MSGGPNGGGGASGSVGARGDGRASGSVAARGDGRASGGIGARGDGGASGSVAARGDAGAGKNVRAWRRLSLRARLVMLGTLGVAVGLGIGGALLVVALSQGVHRSVESDARRTARAVAQLVDEGVLPSPAPVASGQLVQVVDAEHRVRSASINADRLVPLLSEAQVAQARTGRVLFVPGDPAGLDGPLLVVAEPAGGSNDPQVVIVARSVADIRNSIDGVTNALLVAYPLLVIVMAAAGWRVAGAVLRPVEALRAGAERITGTARVGRGAAGGEVDRLPVPPSRDEVHRLAVTLNDMLGRLASARDRQRAFVADAAHELRSPLAAIRTQLEVARHLGESSELADDLLIDVERLGRLIDDLLLLARVDETSGLARSEPVELTDLTHRTVARYGTARVPVVVVAGEPIAGESVVDGPVVGGSVVGGPVVGGSVVGGPVVGGSVVGGSVVGGSWSGRPERQWRRRRSSGRPERRRRRCWWPELRWRRRRCSGRPGGRCGPWVIRVP